MPGYDARQVPTRRALAADAARAKNDAALDPVQRFLRWAPNSILAQLTESRRGGPDHDTQEILRAHAGQQGMLDHGGHWGWSPWGEVRRYITTRAGLDTATATAGAELQFIQQADYIGPTSPLGVLPSLGATIITSDMPMDHVVQSGQLSPDVDWATENPGSNVSDSTFTFALAQARPRELIASVTASAQLLRLSARARTAIALELLRATATKIEAGAFNGDGNAPNPEGILNNSDITTLAVGTDGGPITAALLAKMPRALGENGALFPDSRVAYVTTPAVKAEAQQLVRATGAETVWRSDADVFGERGIATTNIPSNLTKGTSTTVCHAVIFGAWEQLYLHVSPQIEIVVDPYTLKRQGMVELTSYMLADVVLPRASAFIAIKDVTVPAL